MKLNGPISNSCVDGEKEEEEILASETSPEMSAIVVGYALTSKKKKSFLKPKFIRLARYSFDAPSTFCYLPLCLWMPFRLYACCDPFYDYLAFVCGIIFQFFGGFNAPSCVLLHIICGAVGVFSFSSYL